MLELLQLIRDCLEDLPAVHDIYELDPEAFSRSVTPDVMLPYCLEKDAVHRLLNLVEKAYIQGLKVPRRSAEIELEDHYEHAMELDLERAVSRATEYNDRLYSEVDLEPEFDPTPRTCGIVDCTIENYHSHAGDSPRRWAKRVVNDIINKAEEEAAREAQAPVSRNVAAIMGAPTFS